MTRIGMIRTAPLALVVAGLVGCAIQSSEESESSQGQALSLGKPYLALGDSVPFGYNPVDAVNDPKNLKAFVGYPELYVPPPPFKAPFPVANAACEGETSGSFINVTSPDNGCHAWRAAGDAMHVQYASAAQSQLAFALGYLAANPTTATVSIGLGANDLFLVQNACVAQVLASGVSETDPNFTNDVVACELPLIPGTIEAAAGNIAYIAGAIRQSGYAGQLVLVTYYAPQYSNPNDPTFQSIVGLDEAMVQVAQGYPQLGLSIAKGFSDFSAIASHSGGDSCKAGLLYKLPNGTCDNHPSTLGQAVLAAAVATAVPASKVTISPPTF